MPALLARWRWLSWAFFIGLIAVWSPPVGTTVGVVLLAITMVVWRRPGRLAYAAYHAARGAWSLGKWEACKQHLGKVLELGIDAPEIRLGLARCEVRLQNWTDAAAAYKAYAERGGVLGAQDRLHAATAAVEAGDAEWALTLLADLPAEPVVAAVRAEALLKLDRPTAAIEVCRAAIGRKLRLDQELAVVHHVLARSYEQAGEQEKARRTWEKLYAYDPTFPDAAERLGLDPT
ncbi:tetratricopeptide repeat protein [Caldinitratiruptor microaerophilus]|nr:tetratricopeptide repeat protein [Caldinitratiruptor microaerophilus]